MSWIEKYGHGGDLDSAARSFRIEKADLVDFSANINPLGPPKKVLERLQTELMNIIHYPDPAHRGFVAKLAEKLAIDPEMIIVGNGAAECIALAILGLSPKSIGVIRPCFSEYEQCAKKFQIEVKSVTGNFENNFKAHKHELLFLFSETDLVFIGHPNNPTGIPYQFAELLEMAGWTENTNTYLVIDEAFLDFLPSKRKLTLLHMLNEFPKVILLRSMTKFYAIPGLRLGFAVAHPDVVKKMKEKQVTWSVNHLALVAGEMCLTEEEYEQETIEFIETERTYLLEELKNLAGLVVLPGEANFLFVRLPGPMKASDFQYDLGCNGIMIRNCSMYPGLTSQDFRIAIRTREDNDRLLKAMKKVLDNRRNGTWG